MFDTLFVQPIFNFLMLIYAVIPGHNFGLALIIFTILIRLLLLPLLKKQLHHSKIMRHLQPKLKEIKLKTKGDKQAESKLMMELYKEYGISPFGPLGLMIIQLPILAALYSSVSRLVDDNSKLLTFSYDFVLNLPWMKEVVVDISRFDMTLFGVVDLSKHPYQNGSIYIAGVVIVVLSALVQLLTSKQLMITDKEARNIRTILKDASNGKETDQAEMNAALMRMMVYIIPFTVLFVSLKISVAMSLYWLVGGIVAYIQQRRILGQDLVELTNITATVKTGDKEVSVNSEIITKPKKSNKTNSKNSKRAVRKKKRR